MVPSAHNSQLTMPPRAANAPSGHTAARAAPPSQNEPAAHATQLSVALEAPSAVEALPGAHVMAAHACPPPELHEPRVHWTQPSVEFTAPCPDDLATAPLPGGHAMGLHDITTPAADH
jgi:hypothetical protein